MLWCTYDCLISGVPRWTEPPYDDCCNSAINPSSLPMSRPNSPCIIFEPTIMLDCTPFSQRSYLDVNATGKKRDMNLRLTPGVLGVLRYIMSFSVLAHIGFRLHLSLEIVIFSQHGSVLLLLLSFSPNE